MKVGMVAVGCLGLLAVGCSTTEQRRATEKARADARKVEQKVNKAMGEAGVRLNSPESAEEKLRQGAEKAREAGKKAEKKIDDLANRQ